MKFSVYKPSLISFYEKSQSGRFHYSDNLTFKQIFTRCDLIRTVSGREMSRVN